MRQKHLFLPLRSLLAAGLLLLLLLGGLRRLPPARAQAPTPTTSPAGVFDFTLADLGQSTGVLLSPRGELAIPFTTPKDWAIRGEESTITLHYDIFYAGNATPTYLPPQLDGARVHVSLNGIELATFIPRPTNDATLRLPIPFGAVIDPEANDHTLQLTLYAGPDCTELDSIRLVLHDDTQIHLAYTTLPPVTDLSTFPRPLWRERLTPETSLIVLPDAFSDADLSAAAAAAAAIGQKTDGAVRTEIVTAAALTPDQLAQNDIVAVGQPEQNAFTADLYARGLLPTRLRAQPADLNVTTTDTTYTLGLQARSPVSALTGARLVAELPPFHTFAACAGDCYANGRLVSWDIPISGTMTATLQINFNDRPVPASSTPITLTIVNSAGGPLYARGSGTAATDTASVLYDQDRAILYPDDGLLQLIPSPDSADHVVLVVTGASGAGVLKAARALSSAEPVLSFGGSTAIIRAVRPWTQPTTGLAALPQTFSLADLGYRGALLQGIGRKTSSISFDVPANWRILSGSSLTLHYIQSNALNPTLSSLSVELNGNPIGAASSVAGGGTQQLVVPLEPDDLPPGSHNRLRFIAEMGLDDPCLPEDTPLAWMRIDNGSLLTLPRQVVTTTLAAGDWQNLDGPALDLRNVVFVLPDAPNGVELAALGQLANRLGQETTGAGLSPQVARGALDTGALVEQFVIAVGRPTRNAFVAAQNEALPQPFLPGSDVPRETVGSVVYRLGADASLGIIEIMPAPWSPAHPFLLISGSTDEGVAWAGHAYADPTLSGGIDGSVTLVQDERLVSFDANVDSGGAVGAINDLTGAPTQIDLVMPAPTAAATAVAAAPTGVAPTAAAAAIVTVTPASSLPDRYAPPDSAPSPATRALIVGLLAVGALLAVGGTLFSWRKSRKGG